MTQDNPIIVNENLEIIDGQHRLDAHRLLSEKQGISTPVFYVIRKGMGLPAARKFNSGSKRWLPLDYAIAYAADGNKSYKTYLKLKEDYPEVPHKVIVTALTATVNSYSRAFSQGLFEMKKTYDEAHEILRKVEEVVEIVSVGQSAPLGTALIMRIFPNPSYNHSRMLKQLKEYGGTISSVPARQAEMLVALNAIYNLGYKEKSDLNSRAVNSALGFSKEPLHT